MSRELWQSEQEREYHKFSQYSKNHYLNDKSPIKRFFIFWHVVLLLVSEYNLESICHMQLSTVIHYSNVAKRGSGYFEDG